MNLDNGIEEYLKKVRKRLLKEMPKVLKEIEVYENKLASGKLTEKPVPAPQFNE